MENFGDYIFDLTSFSPVLQDKFSRMCYGGKDAAGITKSRSCSTTKIPYASQERQLKKNKPYPYSPVLFDQLQRLIPLIVFLDSTQQQSWRKIPPVCPGRRELPESLVIVGLFYSAEDPTQDPLSVMTRRF